MPETLNIPLRGGELEAEVLKDGSGPPLLYLHGAIGQKGWAPFLDTLAQKLQDNYPYAAPEYAGQMIKPPHHLAQAAHWMTSFINPNNHALDGGRATSALELECIQALGTMIGYDQPLGHLTSGGTVANLEALWVARQNQATTKVLASAQSHYTHQRMSEVLGMDSADIEAARSVGAV